MILTSSRRRRGYAYARVLSVTPRNRRTCQSQCKRHISVTSQSCPIVYQSVYDWREATLIATCRSQTAETAQELSPTADGLSLNKPCDYSGRAHGRAGLEKTSQWCHSTLSFRLDTCDDSLSHYCAHWSVSVAGYSTLRQCLLYTSTRAERGKAPLYFDQRSCLPCRSAATERGSHYLCIISSVTHWPRPADLFLYLILISNWLYTEHGLIKVIVKSNLWQSRLLRMESNRCTSSKRLKLTS